jgi:hypothetical protein
VAVTGRNSATDSPRRSNRPVIPSDLTSGLMPTGLKMELRSTALAQSLLRNLQRDRNVGPDRQARQQDEWNVMNQIRSPPG